MARRNIQHPGTRGCQRGVALLLILIAMTTLILMAGLALDVGHMMLNKARLQNTADAAALAAAKILDETNSTTLATAAALQAFGLNAADAGNQELSSGYSNGSIQVTVQYSSAMPPFTPGSATGPYVRIIATGFAMPTSLVAVSGLTQLSVAASAVAGPSPTANTACNLAPMMVCGNPNPPAGSFWGYTVNAPQVLKSAAPGSAAVGPGNFQLIQLGGSGANIVRQNLAGSYQACINATDSVQTEPGNATGPTAQGLNTRFGQYSGPVSESQYPPDVLTTGQSPVLTVNSSGQITLGQNGPVITVSNINQLLYSYASYLADEANPAAYQYQPVSSGGPGVFNRRVLSVPIGNCTGTSNGSTTVPVLGFGCFFLLQPVSQTGNTDYAFGQFIGNCDVNGEPGPAPNSGPGPYIIQLYHDPASGDS